MVERGKPCRLCRMEDKIKHLKFNQDFGWLGMGTDEGFNYLSVENFGRGSNENVVPIRGGVRIVERMFCSHLAAIVPVTSPRKLLLLNISTNHQLCYLYFSSSILAVRLNKKKLVVILENKIYIYDIMEMKVLKEIALPPNPDGFMELSSNADILAYPLMEQSGIVEVYDMESMKKKIKILAHASTVACIALNESGTLIATASEKGTLIRVFTTSEGSRAFEFRRGLMRNASIQSMVFSPDGMFLAASSDTATIHVFKLQPSRNTELDNSWTGWLKASIASIPQTDKFFEERAFATISTTTEGARKSVLGFRLFASDTSHQQLCVLVASYDGILKVYSLNAQLGGECTLLKQYMFLQLSPVQANGASTHSTSNPLSTLTQSALPAIPDLINQATVNFNLGYGIIQSVLTDAANTILEKTGAGGGSGNQAPVEQEVEQDMPPGMYDCYVD